MSRLLEAGKHLTATGGKREKGITNEGEGKDASGSGRVRRQGVHKIIVDTPPAANQDDPQVPPQVLKGLKTAKEGGKVSIRIEEMVRTLGETSQLLTEGRGTPGNTGPHASHFGNDQRTFNRERKSADRMVEKRRWTKKGGRKLTRGDCFKKGARCKPMERKGRVLETELSQKLRSKRATCA